MLTFAERKCSYPKTLWSSFADLIIRNKDLLNHTICVFPSESSIVRHLLIFISLIVTLTDIYLLWRRLKTTSVPNMKRILPTLEWLPVSYGDAKIIVQAMLTEWSINMLLHLLTENYDGLLFSLLALQFQFLISIYAAYQSQDFIKFSIHVFRIFATPFQFSWLLCHLTKYFGACVWT